MADTSAAVTAVTEDYLKALWSAEMRGQGMSVNQLAHKMGVVASTASENVTRLKALGLVDHEPYKKVHLSEKGRTVAVGMIRRHRIIETYLYQALGFDWDELHVEAEILEHAISDRLLDRLDHVLGRPTRDPHGDPIPAPDGTVQLLPLKPLTTLESGERGIISRIADEHPNVLRDLHGLGLNLDTHIVMLGRETDGGAQVQLIECAEPCAPIYLSNLHTTALYVVVDEE